MHLICRFWLAGLIVALAPLMASGQAAPKVKQVRIGLPSTGKSADESGRSRSGSWAPVAVTIESSAAGHPRDAYRLRIETTDLEEQAYQYVVAVPAMSANNTATVLGYIVPGSDSAVFKVQLETVEGRAVHIRDKISRDATRGELVGEQDILFLAAGAGLSSLKQATENLERPPDDKGKAAQDDDPFRGKRSFVFAEDVTALPDRWYGYDSVDVVVLGTGKVDFVNTLASGDPESDTGRRRSALLDWVRRGGQLILSVGRNQQQVGELLKRMPLLDCKIEGSRQVATLPALTRFGKPQGAEELLRKVEVAVLKPGPESYVLVREEFGPVMVESSCGLGRVVLLAFDLDTGEFAGWKGREGFWKELQTRVSPHLPIGGQRNNPNAPPGMGGFGDDSNRLDHRAEMKYGLESFEEVPTITFLPVALFILFYILLVGPLDYFLLKKVFKRLELTWITFPVAVLVVSVLAYLGAYAKKGDELRINKIDLIDVDLHQPNQAYGQSWFTLFSTRAQSYTVGIEPASDVWTGAIPPGAPGPVVTLLEGGDNSRKQSSQSLFKKPYLYAEDATGLQYVPVPVWSTRSFTATWRAPLHQEKGKVKPPIGITDDSGPIRYSRDEAQPGLVGRLTNNLPVPLKDVCLFYQDQFYILGDMAPNEQRRVEQHRDAPKLNVSEFFDPELNPNARGVLRPGLPLAPSGRPVGQAFAGERTSYKTVKKIMFYQRSAKLVPNPGMRVFDQSWRLGKLPNQERYRDEIILVARTPMLCDYARVVNEHPASCSRLWVGKLPAAGEDRPEVRGVLTQETYLRMFIPVKRSQ